MEFFDCWLLIIPITFILVILLALPFVFIKKRQNNTWLLSSIYVLILVWISRFCATHFGTTDSSTLSLAEQVFDSLIHALQTFSMDEDYTVYSVAGKDVLNSMGLTNWAKIYGIVIYLLNLIAPILGGALLLDILTGTIPYLKVIIHPLRHKFVFSELNEESICLAEDIFRDKNYKKLLDMKWFDMKPLVIFTDVYTDDESETSSELEERAKNIGAICIKKDLTRINFSHSKSVAYILIDKNTSENISAFSSLIDCPYNKCLWPLLKLSEDDANYRPVTSMYIFVHNAAESELVRNIGSKSDKKSKVLFRTVQDYMNTSLNLMREVPLFYPLLLNKNRKEELHLTLIGSGNIAKEVFKAIYWCGQMPNIKLIVNVISNDVSSFKKELKEECPEMMECIKKDSIHLKVFPSEQNSQYNPPYLESLNLIKCEDALSITSYQTDILEKTDYYIITLGSDENNSILANKLSVHLGRMRLENKCSENVIIVPAIYNSRLSESLNNGKVTFEGIQIFTFAALTERFSCKNVFMTEVAEEALATEKLYNYANQLKMQDDEYTYWANHVRALHAPYKLFGLGLLTPNGDHVYKYSGSRILSEEQQSQLAWIEHRRWNAFLRTQGFICPSELQLDTYFTGYKGHKSVKLKLHPCLVECQAERHHLCLYDSPDFNSTLFDCLDFVSIKVYTKKCQLDPNKPTPTDEDLRTNGDFKKWDYPSYDDSIKKFLENVN